jgi:RNA polymerase sigma factor (sigma-70 family)
MPATPHTVLEYLRCFLARSHGEETSDCDLLRRFRESREGDAFARLLQRHGPMVLALARRVLHDAQAAEDIFQAVFLTLARKASSIRRPEALACWLHGVTLRMALRAKHSRLRQRRRETHAPAAPPPTPLDELTAAELLAVLDAELHALPEIYRGPLLLCYLEGLSQEEAGRRLGCSAGAVKGRLERGRARLQVRLQKRGLALPAVLAGATLVPGATAAVQPALARATLEALVSGGASPGALALVRGATPLLGFLPRLQGAVLALVLFLLAGTGLSVMAFRSPGARDGDEQKSKAAAPPGEPAPHRKGVDRYGDPLPDGVVMRLGTLQRRALGAKLAVSADGKAIIGVRAGKYLSVWDAVTGKLRQRRELPALSSSLSALSPDGRWLLTDENRGGRLTLWDVRTGKPTHRWVIKGASYFILAAFSEDGKRVAVGGGGGGRHYIRAWDLTTGKEIFAHDIASRTASQLLAFTPDGKGLLYCLASIEEGMHCWDMATGKLLWQNKEFVPSSLVITPDGKILSSMQTLPVLDLATGRPARLKDMPPLTWGTRLTLTRSGRTLLLATASSVTVWDLVRGKKRWTLDGAGAEVVAAPDGKTAFTNTGALQGWDLTTGKSLYPDNFDHGHIGEVLVIAFSADGKRLASGAADGSVRLWDVATGKPLHVWRGHQARQPVRLLGLTRAGVTALDISPNGRWVVSAGSEERLRLYDATTGKQGRALAFPAAGRGEEERRVYHLRVNADGTRVVGLFGAEAFIHIQGEEEPPPTAKLATWDLRSGRLLGWRPVEMTRTLASAISSDGRTLLSNGVLTDVASVKETARLEGVTLVGSMTPFALARDGTLVVGGFEERTRKGGLNYVSPGGVRTWETATGKTVGHVNKKEWIGQVALHSSGRLVVTNDLNGIQVWDVLTGKQVAARQMPERVRSTTTPGSYASCLAFAPDGRRLATGHPDGTILVWDFPVPKAAPRPLAAKELDSLWADLAAADAARAWRAVWRLADFPAEALPLLRQRLKPTPPTPADLMQRLLADLDSKSFRKRQAAGKQLQTLGPRALPALRQALAGDASVEQKKQIEKLLAELRVPQPLAAESLRSLRAVAVLERVASPDARRMLAELAQSGEAVQVTRAARAALGRRK